MGPDAIEAGGIRWQVRSGVDARATAARLAAAVAEVEAGRIPNLKTGRRKALYEIALDGNGTPDHLLKVNRYAGADGWLRRLRGSKARREFALAQAVAGRGIPTPLPLAFGEAVAAGRLHACYLAVPRLARVVDLQRLGPLEASERRSLARAFGRLSRRIHEAGIFQEDFAPNNFLVRRGPAPELYMIDYERAQLRRRPLAASARRYGLAKLERRLPQVGRSDRFRFLVAYAQGDRVAARDLWRSLDAFLPRLARWDLRRLMRTTTRNGRRYHTVETQGARVWARRDAPLEAILEKAAEGDGWWLLDAPAEAREGARTWACANLLWLRSLGPRPLALVRRDAASALFLERVPGMTRLADLAEPEAVRGELVGLLCRLLALGTLEAPRASDFAQAPGGGLLYLAPGQLRVGRSLPAGRLLRRARELAGRILDPARA